ncbi:MAG TPA: hypothetical protein VJB59_15000 [Bdellovibrionota bacterium]|nr:hypothetical protein [Bdellovibrionota bacterium]
MSSTHLSTLVLFFIMGLGGLSGVFAQPCMASAPVSARLFANLGPWISKFEQSDGLRNVDITTKMSGAAQLQLGIDVSLLFVEYNASWLASAYSANPKARDASYFSPLGLNVGISLPVLPLEFYVGGEKGSYKLNGGVNPSYSGLAAKAGINLVFRPPGTHAGIGLKAEFRRFYGSSDDAGSLPAGITTRADTYFLGMTFGRK